MKKVLLAASILTVGIVFYSLTASFAADNAAGPSANSTHEGDIVKKSSLVGNAKFSFLEKHPQILAELLKWESESPENIVYKINLFRNGDTNSKIEAAYGLRQEILNKGLLIVHKGATLSLLEVLDDTTEYKGNMHKFLLTGGSTIEYIVTSPSEEAGKTLALFREFAVEPLIAVLGYLPNVA